MGVKLQKAKAFRKLFIEYAQKKKSQRVVVSKSGKKANLMS